MATLHILRLRQRRLLRRDRVFRDKTHPFEVFDDIELYRKFRFRRLDILDITNEITDANRKNSLTPLLQVLVTLRYFATSSFQDVCGELIGVDQATVSRAVTWVINALFLTAHRHIRWPNQEEADETKKKIFTQYGFPNVVGCVDGSQIRIQAPHEQEHEFVNRKGYHSMNVQLICDDDLVFIHCISKWPGSVHDARILRESPLFEAFESAQKPLDGIILDDSAYMLREWLFTPLANPTTANERAYNARHSSARSIIERSIGVLKRRWHCLRRLRVQPTKAYKIIMVCVALFNRCRRLNLHSADSDMTFDIPSQPNDNTYDQEESAAASARLTELVRNTAGAAARRKLIVNYF